MTKIELLAPAKNLETGKAAIAAGADAVYIGGPKFGARSAAGNTIEDIAELANYAHKYFAKVYVTLNVLIYESEIYEVEKLINELYNAKIDALIIQDLAILKMNIPSDLPLFASTQTNNYSLERIKFLDSLGFERLILARELSLEQIHKISDNTSCEIESFIFGALCVSLSGQCYMSAAATGRSANRGECSQMCRHRYNLTDGADNIIVKDKFLLSLRDMNQENHLNELLEAGVTSFKIEGRLKDIDYVTNVTAYFRQKLDDIMAKSGGKYVAASSGRCVYNFEPDLRKTFNRGFTDYCISGSNDDIANINSPKSIGKYIGKIISAAGLNIKIDTTEKINSGDGICYFFDGELLGFRVNSADENILHLSSPVQIPQNTPLYRNNDTSFEKLLAQPSSACKFIDAKISITEIADGLHLSACDEDGITADEDLICELIPADNPEKAVQNIEKQLKKSGGTIFKIIEITGIKPYFLKISALNEVRRKLLDKLELARLARPIVKTKRGKTTEYTAPNNFQDNFSLNISNSLSRQIYSDTFSRCDSAAPEVTGNFENIPLMTTRYCIRRELHFCPKFSDAKPAPDMLFLNDNSHSYRLEFDCSHCFMKIFKA